MPLSALLLVLAAACMHVGWNAFAKRSHDQLVFLWTAMLLGGLLLAAPAAVIVLRTGMDASGWPHAAASAAVHAAYFTSLSRAYGSGDLSLVYPLSRGLSIALVAMLAWPLLGEAPARMGLAGVFLVVAGAALVTRRGPTAASPAAGRTAAAADRTSSGAGAAWAVLTGLLITAYSLIDKQGTAQMDPLPYLVVIILGACLLLSPWILLRRRQKLVQEWRAHRKSLALAAIFSVSAYLLVLYAMQRAPVSYVVAAREISIVLSVLIGRIWMGEQPPIQRFAGAAVIVAGVACLALAR